MQSLWMLVASLLFSIMGVCVKLAGDYYTTAEIVLCRGIVGITVITTLVWFKGGTFRTPFPKDHLIRGGVGVCSLWLWFYSFSLLPIATATTLNYMSSIWIAVMLFAAGWWKGNKRFEWGLAGTVLLSFIGVAMLMRPSLNGDEMIGGAIALFSGVLSALVYLQVRKLGLLGEPEYRVVFYFSVTGVVAGIIGNIFTGKMPFMHDHTPYGIALAFTIGLSATLAQIAMTRAYRLGNTLLTANLQYTGIVFASLFGVVIWNDAPGWVGWAGITVILGSGILATFHNQRSRQAKNAPPVDPIATEV